MLVVSVIKHNINKCRLAVWIRLGENIYYFYPIITVSMENSHKHLSHFKAFLILDSRGGVADTKGEI